MVEGFVDRIGRPIARFVRQRLRMFPPDFGDNTYMVSVPLDRVRGAIESLDRLFAHLSYRGVFEAEFKYDDRDGQFKLLEVNARPWYFIGLAAECGVDLLRNGLLGRAGRSVDPVTTY
jgi:predicted ATP-grasp superfamily ATP-dependent carboligase